MGRCGHPRRKVLDLIDAGRKVVDIARDLGISDQTIDLCVAERNSIGLIKGSNQGLEPGLFQRQASGARGCMKSWPSRWG